MNRTIWKYHLEIKDEQILQVPACAEFLEVKIQDGLPCLWALVNPESEKVSRKIVVLGTGHNFQAGNLKFLGTFLIRNDLLVFHVFEDQL